MWIDDYFSMHYPMVCTVSRSDRIVHQLVHQLLLIGEEQLTGRPGHFKLHQQANILVHEEQINAIMSAMKPGLLKTIFVPYDKKIVLKYLLSLKKK